ncbi:Peptidase A1 [Neofusicoccum parvum]|uniref:Peptidase A1 n=1 Tax=Neofusicoccum parvum TaxID=310453 RepID=A0ACB5S3W5_9PEZI|nr:Peptidase A1 [Neofusicoccum parvum]
MLPILLSLLAASSAAQPTKRQDGKPVFMPLKYPYNGYPKVYADIYFGTPAQTPIETVVDLGSADYWVYGPNATIYYGSPYLGVEGPCHLTPEPSYDPYLSSTATGFRNQTRGFAYGGNGKILTSYYSVNDTISFSSAAADAALFPSLAGTQVAITNRTLIKIRADQCTGTDYDSSILGIAEAGSGTNQGPSFRANLLDAGAIDSATLSMWFDAPPAGTRDDYRGTMLLGAVPAAASAKYAGSLVQVPKRQPEGSVGYYVDRPVWRVGERAVKLYTGYYNTTTTTCLLDSGSGQDYLPLDEDDFLDAVGGLVIFNGRPAWNGTCESIPADKAVSLTFGGVKEGESVTVDVPLRNWARGNADYFNNTNICGLSMELSNADSCILASPFSSAAFLAVNDELGQIALAQGGVSSGATDGYEGLGEVEYIAKGQGLL